MEVARRQVDISVHVGWDRGGVFTCFESSFHSPPAMVRAAKGGLQLMFKAVKEGFTLILKMTPGGGGVFYCILAVLLLYLCLYHPWEGVGSCLLSIHNPASCVRGNLRLSTIP